MGSVFGKNLRISLFGESHGPAIGITMDGLPSGILVDLSLISEELARRAPKKASYSTKRKESDIPKILSGIYEGKTTGTPLTAIIENSDTRSGDYEKTALLLRPSHADYTGHIRYSGFQDPHGGGHFSGRLTAPLVFAGAICKQALLKKGITVGGHISRLGGLSDTAFDSVNLTKETLISAADKTFSVLDDVIGAQMLSRCEEAAKKGDSLGGVIECAVLGLPAGIGDPIFDNVESVISHAVFSIPAVKGVEFGSGFALADMTGIMANDCFTVTGEKLCTKTNHSGGILGGITNGMPLIFRAAFKPTPSIGMSQQTVNLSSLTEETLTIHGRHDPCVVPRALPVVEAVTAIALVDLLLSADGYRHF